MPTYLTIKETADILRISTRTVRRWLDAGRLEFIQRGSGTIKIKESEIERFVKESTVKRKKILV